MSTEDFYQPLPNVVSIKKEIRLKFPKNPWNINSENNYWTSEDQTLALWGKEFKFGFEFTPGRREKLDLVNRSSRPVWIIPINFSNLPAKIRSNEKLSRIYWNAEYQEDGICVIGSFKIVLGIDYDPVPLLQHDLLALLSHRSKNFTDFKLKCGEEEFPCHKSILAARSPVLANAFAYSSEEEDQYEIKGFDSSALKKLLDALYFGTVAAGNVDDELLRLADYLDVDFTKEKGPELRPLHPSLPAGIQTLKDWKEWTYFLHHESQIEPSLAAKIVDMVWTIDNYEVRRHDFPANHVELLPVERITLLDKDFYFQYEIHYGQRMVRLINQTDAEVFLRGGNSRRAGLLTVLRPNGGHSENFVPFTIRKNVLIVNFEFTILMWLDLDHESQLQRDLLRLLREKQFSDFKLSCGGKEFPCHKAILAARLPAFAQIFEGDPRADHHEIEGFQPSKVKQMLEFIYSEAVAGDADLELLRLANKFKIKGLVKLCGRSLAKTVTLANALDLFDVADSQPDGALKNLEDSVLDFCAINYRKLRRSDQWKSREPKCLPSVKIGDILFSTRRRYF